VTINSLGEAIQSHSPSAPDFVDVVYILSINGGFERLDKGREVWVRTKADVSKSGGEEWSAVS